MFELGHLELVDGIDNMGRRIVDTVYHYPQTTPACKPKTTVWFTDTFRGFALDRLKHMGWRYPNQHTRFLTYSGVSAADPEPAGKGIVEQDSAKRKDIPLATGVLDYFPAALCEVAKLSKAGNDKHNPGQPLHWSRDKSLDHADCIARHLIERGGFDSEGNRHSAALAWRALALLQTELEAEGLVDVPVTPRL